MRTEGCGLREERTTIFARDYNHFSDYFTFVAIGLSGFKKRTED
jgi:hypothetical protein